jgi:hypothetical protein
MPKDANTIRERLRGKPHRIIFRQFDVMERAPTSSTETMLIAEGEIWARRWRLPVGAMIETPDPSSGGGPFFIPLQGSLAYREHEYTRWSTIYVGPRDGRIELRAGANGVDVIGVQFAPQP